MLNLIKQMSNDNQNKLFQTNNYSIVSKYSCVKSGYQRDVVLSKFMEDWLKVKSCNRTALINRGYAARMMSIDWIVNRSIKIEGVDCFIILGAGYDFLPFRNNYYSKYNNCAWVELDLHEVISTKSEFIKSNQEVLGDNDEELTHIRDGYFRTTSSRYHLIECDLRNSEMLSTCLSEVFISFKAKKVAILNEVCLCYISVDENRKILTTVIDTVREFAHRVYYIGYEQYRPSERSPFNDIMLRHFSLMSYPLKHFPTPGELRQLFLGDLNFNHLNITPVYQIYYTALQEDREEFKSANQNQPFDEYEELYLYLSHYALVTGVLILKDPFIDIYASRSSDEKEEDLLSDSLGDMMMGSDSTKGTIVFKPINFERYGHSSCAIENENDGSYSIFMSGGFGKSLATTSNSPHKRLNDCVVINGDTSLELIGTENIDPTVVKLDRMHGQVMSPGKQRLFFNGGRRSPSKRDHSNVAFLAQLIDNSQLEMLYSFNQTNEFVRWRHQLCQYGNSNQFMQVGGLTLSENTDPLILWDLSPDKLGASIVRLRDIDLFRRHSFGMDARDMSTIMLMGGLKTSDITKDLPIDLDSNTILWDIRDKKLHITSFECANSYGFSIHFINENQLVKLGGISTKTGLAETTIQLLDLRNNNHIPVAEDVLPLADQRLILINNGVCHLKNTHEIITTGGGGNYFTFGTRFNKSHLHYRYKY